MQLLYGTGNTAKLAVMKRRLYGLDIEIVGVSLEVEEEGETLSENARQKAKAYYEVFQKPVFSCDTKIYFKNENFPKQLQPGIHTRRIGGRMYSDEEMIVYYRQLAKEYGGLIAQYQSAVCCYLDETHVYECAGEVLWGEPFVLTDYLHENYQPGFPLDGLSVECSSGIHYYDLPQEKRDKIAIGEGIRDFFEKILEEQAIK